MSFHRCQFPDPLRLVSIFLLLLVLAPAGTASGQTSFDLTGMSAYTARGAALDTHPVLQLRVEHDAETDRYAGWYAGGFASPAAFFGREQAQLTAYGGRAQPLTSTLSWDAGVTGTVFSAGRTWNYHEFYIGLAWPRASARLFYSPAYYGEGHSAYLDLNGAYPLGERLRLVVHAGLLHALGEYRGDRGDGSDVRIALAADVGDVTLQAGWQVKAHVYLVATPPARALTASASLRF